MRLTEKFRREELIPLGSRIRIRLTLQPLSAEELRTTLKHLITVAGNPALMSAELISTLSEHTAGNLRMLMSLSGELLAAAAQKELPQLDEKLYFEVFSLHRPTKPLSAVRQRS